MSKTEQRRQKKLAKKRSKEIAKRKQMAHQRNVMQSIAGQVSVAASGSIEHCLVGDSLFEDYINLGMVLITRRLADGRVACVWFTIDMLCLGVKDHYALVGFPGQINDYVERVHERQPMHSVSPPFARKLVESAIDYAAQFELQPAPGYQKLAAIWGDIDSSECSEEFKFGADNGKPRYVSGPNDSRAFQAKVADTLQRAAGEGNFDVVIMDRINSGSLDRIEMLSGDEPESQVLPESFAYLED